ncbi:MAG: hypothetical protein ABIX01_07925 [Chitinophagaceae bacterium]
MEIKLFIEGLGAHVSQIYTGFGLLEEAGLVKLSFNKGRFFRPLRGIVCAELNNKRIVYDLGDNPETIMQDYYPDADFYFKRMAQQSVMDRYPKILPLGLNYPVFSPSDHFLKCAVIMKSKEAFARAMLNRSGLLSNVVGIKSASASSDIQSMQALPNPLETPKVIFAGRLWNQETSDAVKNAERKYINQQRIDIIRLLKNRLGDHFIGGLVDDELSRKAAPELILPRNTFTEKGSYVKHLRQCAIGIASPGLETSVGFKFAEYIAFSKAIITTPVNAVTPGNLAPDVNYQIYNTPQECLEKVELMIADHKLRKDTMEHNFAYYQQYLRPDKLVWNSILQVNGFHG